eukprot:COSAG02_NODE_21687_length_778_cov_1.536082_2_plen_190_part_01
MSHLPVSTVWLVANQVIARFTDKLTAGFENNEVSTTIELSALVDGSFDEGTESILLTLTPDDDYVAVAGETDSLTATLIIENDEVCDGWPPAIPVSAKRPCTVSELAQPADTVNSDGTRNRCDERGTCPADGATLVQHTESCTFVCAEGYDPIDGAAQPSCDGTSMSSTFQCQQQQSTVGFAEDSLTVQV